MVEVTQADKAEAIRYWGNDNPPIELQAAFARHRIAVLEEAAASLRSNLLLQMEERDDDDTPSSIQRGKGLVWLDGWFDLAAAIRVLKGEG